MMCANLLWISTYLSREFFLKCTSFLPFKGFLRFECNFKLAFYFCNLYVQNVVEIGQTGLEKKFQIENGRTDRWTDGQTDGRP